MDEYHAERKKILTLLQFCQYCMIMHCIFKNKTAVLILMIINFKKVHENLTKQHHDQKSNFSLFLSILIHTNNFMYLSCERK
jgi:hypothetical protein